MRKLVPLIWSVIGAFLTFATCVPLGHICLDRIDWADPVSSGHPAYAFMPGPHVVSQEGDPSLKDHPPSRKDGVCPACLWSQNLLRTSSASGLAVARTFTVAPLSFAAPSFEHRDCFQSALKRGPPLSQTAN